MQQFAALQHCNNIANHHTTTDPLEGNYMPLVSHQSPFNIHCSTTQPLDSSFGCGDGPTDQQTDSGAEMLIARQII